MRKEHRSRLEISASLLLRWKSNAGICLRVSVFYVSQGPLNLKIWCVKIQHDSIIFNHEEINSAPSHEFNKTIKCLCYIIQLFLQNLWWSGYIFVVHTATLNYTSNLRPYFLLRKLINYYTRICKMSSQHKKIKFLHTTNSAQMTEKVDLQQYYPKNFPLSSFAEGCSFVAKPGIFLTPTRKRICISRILSIRRPENP